MQALGFKLAQEASLKVLTNEVVKLLPQREYNLTNTAHEFDYLVHASNADRWDIQQDALLADWRYFGFDSLSQAEVYRNQVMYQIELAAGDLESDGLSTEQSQFLRTRMSAVIRQLTHN